QPYQAMRLMSGPRQAFASRLNAPQSGSRSAEDLSGVTVYGLQPMNLPTRRVYEPANPAADSSGYVTYPGFDQAGEMTLMVKTARAYEADIVAMNAARQMYVKALELGKKS